MKNKLELLAKTGLEFLPLAMGATLAGVGRLTGAHWIPAVPPAMDLISGAQCLENSKGILSYIKYGIGVALPYTDVIYTFLENYCV